ncbi:MAG: FecR domain-containing protein [Myxococcota bacterium]
MSCIHYQDLLSLGTDPSARVAIERHSETCPECGPALARLKSSAEILRAYQPPMALGARARIWRGLEQPPREPSVPWFRWLAPVAGLAVAAGALLAVLVDRVPPEPVQAPTLVAGEVKTLDSSAPVPRGALPLGTWVKTAEPTKVDLGRWKMDTQSGSVVHLAALERGNLDVRLFRGEASFAVDRLNPEEVLLVTTRQARLQAFGSRVRVGADDEHTAIDVEEGRVLVYREGESKPVLLLPGQKLEIRAHPSAAPSAPSAAAPASVPPAAPIVAEPVSVPMPPAPASSPRVAPKAPVAPSPPSVAPAAAPLTPPPAPTVADSEAQLKVARTALKEDAPKAAQLATEVLSSNHDAKVEVEALLLLADANRRNGALHTAAELYLRAAGLPAGQAYAEEALEQRAELLVEIGDPGGALTTLRDADARFPSGPFAPERARMEAEIELSRGDRVKAIAALERAAARARAQGDLSRARTFEARADALGR